MSKVGEVPTPNYEPNIRGRFEARSVLVLGTAPLDQPVRRAVSPVHAERI